ncbi:unnamed protein product [Caenorhabditis bovis]|uniref:Uncharacterized protein n=1 Tax=Caenorhabditis bovis TaxID=2654633 RepID=A0A8S1F2A1_9PELO|nr:unnamed protein product [Caenorhabditis bovis]
MPLMMQSRWDLLAYLRNAELISLKNLPNSVFDELSTCSMEQDCAARCSSLIISLASFEDSQKDASRIIVKGLESPSGAVRSNVVRSWLSRLISVRKTQKCVELVIETVQNHIKSLENSPILPLSFRDLRSFTCVDLEWRSTFDDDPFSDCQLALMAYLDIFIAFCGAGAQYSIRNLLEIEILKKCLKHYDENVRLLAYEVCRKYKIYPTDLECQLLRDLERDFCESVMREIDDEMLKNLSDSSQETIMKIRMSESEKDKSSRFYPASNCPQLDGIISVEDFEASKSSLDNLLKLQCPSEAYPSVAAVMNVLRSLDIDERAFVSKITSLLECACAANHKEYSKFVFEAISKCPLRAVVDFGGEIIRRISLEDFKFREAIFEMACDLFSTATENTRALTFEVCFLGTIGQDSKKFTRIWTICKNLKNVEKRRKMFEMLAKIVANSGISIETNELLEMMIESLNYCCTQLFVATTGKILEIRHEVDRCYLFVIGRKKNEVYRLIDEILSKNPSEFSKKAFHLALFFFSRFVICSFEFYNASQLATIRRICRFILYTLRRFSKDQIMISAGVEAICGFVPWDNCRDFALNSSKYSESLDYLERIIIDNLHHYHYCYLLQKSIASEKFVKIADVLDLQVYKFMKISSDEPNLERAVENFVKETTNCAKMPLLALTFALLCERIKES